jgi:formate hydrogenlyase transcriptional activator
MELDLSANAGIEGSKSDGAAVGASYRWHDLPAEASSFAAQLQATLNAIPAYTWYKLASGTLAFVNERSGDYLGLPQDHPLRRGADTDATWDSHIFIIHPDDQEVARQTWTECLRNETAGEASFRIRNASGEYHWFIVRTEPLRADDGTLLYWVGISFDIETQKQAEFRLTEGHAALRKSERELRQILDFTPQFIGVFGSRRERLYINQVALDYLGKTRSEWLDGSPGDVVHPEDAGMVQSRWESAVRDGVPFEIEVRLRKRDGSYRWCLGRFNPVRDEEGQILQWYVACTDIEDQKQAAAEQEQLTRALRKNETEFRQIVELTPLFVTVLGPRRERLYINRVGLDYLGTTLERWREKQPRDEVHPDDVEQVLSRWRQALSDGLPFECEFRARRSDGVYRWLLGRCNSVRDDDGQVLRWYIAFTDIEERKRAEEKLQQENAALREEINQTSIFGQIVGSSEPLQKVVAEAYRAAQTDATVLILGETGTGKELIARAIHKRSARRPRAFIAVNCATIPSALIASELFGHEKGAFTGATQRRLGRFEAANGGTIFLDEVGDLPPDAQIALLRVLQEREVERVGSDKPIPVNVRVLAATHRDLSKLVHDGVFRQDLFYRLNVVPLKMPPLRERIGDIALLVEYFLAGFARKTGKEFSRIEKRTLDVLRAYDWPGNVRELQNMIERAVTLSDSDIFSVDEAWLKREPAEISDNSPELNGALLAHEKEAIEAALVQSHGRVSGPAGAAARLGIPATTLDSKIKRLGIDKYRFKQADS